jgi:hypothetical protein
MKEVKKMGYIVPVVNFQSNQYIERNLIASRDPYKYESVTRVIPIKSGTSEGNQHQQSSFSKRLIQREEKKVLRPSNEALTHIYEITGKGKYLDISV